LEYAEAGLLLAYGPSAFAQYPRVVPYIDKILRGAKAADLPVEQPTKFDLTQHENREGDRPHDPAIAAGAGGSGD
jgi:hypothetical protein